jgi:hypothetical protein
MYEHAVIANFFIASISRANCAFSSLLSPEHADKTSPRETSKTILDAAFDNRLMLK